ncbi:DUF488 family protein [Pseudothauera nasutitermitis]|uniref:DUF488 family protein n=1 Tax=Pseudothauera nasutitermitis TaxID=2565930 RepID=A0A4V3WCK7_9RHOO|nr:DUF488 family protein [Pseudothauera nasutitermitis]
MSIKRVYADADGADGMRILVDRIWPRGLTRDAAKVDLWLKEVAPSGELRKWFGHDPDRWAAFQERYRAELAGSAALAELRGIVAGQKAVTLVYAARDEARNNAVVLRQVLAEEA